MVTSCRDVLFAPVRIRFPGQDEDLTALARAQICRQTTDS